MQSKRIQLGFITVIAAVVATVYIYNDYFSKQALLEQIKAHNGYKVEVIGENVPLEVFIKPEYFSSLQEQDGEEKALNIFLHEQNNTEIILQSIFKREQSLYFSFTTDYKLNRSEGEFLYNGIFNQDGSFTTNSGWNEFEAFNPKKETIELGQAGSGPNSNFSFSINKDQWGNIKDGIYVRYNGMYLHGYKKD